jgi:hypothetical protein
LSGHSFRSHGWQQWNAGFISARRLEALPQKAQFLETHLIQVTRCVRVLVREEAYFQLAARSEVKPVTLWCWTSKCLLKDSTTSRRWRQIAATA